MHNLIIEEDKIIAPSGTIIKFLDFPNLSREEVIETAIKYRAYEQACTTKAIKERRHRADPLQAQRYLYMATTRDKYELPVAVADSVKELAEMLNLSSQRVSEYICKTATGVLKGTTNKQTKIPYLFYRIELEEKDLKEFQN